jgi:hypothetical protein
MNRLGIPLILLCLVAAEDKPAPKLPIGKETTYVTGPLDKEGYIDYEAALNERLGKGITPERNANVLLWKALGPRPEGAIMPAEFFKQMGIAEPPQDGVYFIRLTAFMTDYRKLDPSKFDAIKNQQDHASRRPWAAKEYPQLAAWLTANEKPLAIAIEATRRPDYFNPLCCPGAARKRSGLLGALLPSVPMCRDLAIALASRAMLRVEENMLDEAWQDLIACHRLGRLVARGGILIETMVGMGIDRMVSDNDLVYLERAKLSTDQVRSCLKDLQNLPPFISLAEQIDLGVRFLYLDSIQLVRRGSNSEDEKLLGLIDWEPALRQGNLFYDRMSTALRVQDRAGRQKELRIIEEEVDKIQKDLKLRKVGDGELAILAKRLLGTGSSAKTVGMDIGNAALCLLMPAASKVQNARDQADQVHRNLHIAFALAAYHRDHGRYPAKLDDLAPGYLAAVPDDLFSGKALVYRPAEKGYLLYSVGANGKDDDGRSFGDDPAGDDLPVRMPLPELKRKK